MDGKFRRASKPIVIHFCASIRHLPDDIDEKSVACGAINPATIIRTLLKIIRKSRVGQRLHNRVAITWMNQQIQILCVPPTTGINRQTKSASQKKIDFRFSNDLQSSRVTSPFFIAYELRPNGFLAWLSTLHIPPCAPLL